MKILDKYIFTQVLFATLLGILVFLVFWISPEILFKTVKEVINGNISGNTAFQYIVLEIPEILGKAIPVGLMIGSLFVFDRLSRDSELIILRGIGVSFSRFILPVLLLGIIGIGVCYSIYEYFIPYSTSTLKILKKEVNKSHFVYMDKNIQGKPVQILIVGSYDGSHISNIKLLSFSDKVNKEAPLMKSIITADNATWKGDYWTLENGIEYEIAPDGVYESIKHFASRNVLSPDASQKAYKLLVNSTKKANEMNLYELRHYINLLNELDIKDEANYFQSKYFQRFTQPVSCLLLVLCGVILGFSKPREKRFVGFTIGVGIVFVYYTIMPFLDMLSQTGVLPPAIAAWLPNILITIALAILVKYKGI